ncbi:hypothetical protein IAT38_006973 [Cryptococcus sp. DSM 104549]
MPSAHSSKPHRSRPAATPASKYARPRTPSALAPHSAASQSISRLKTTVSLLQYAATTAGSIAQGAAWLPGVGAALDVLKNMLASAEKVEVGKIQAFKLVERYAIVWDAVGLDGSKKTGKISPGLQRIIDQLLEQLNDSARYLEGISSRSFIDGWWHRGEIADRIESATQELADRVTAFQLQNIILTNESGEELKDLTKKWGEELREELEADTTLIVNMLGDLQEEGERRYQEEVASNKVLNDKINEQHVCFAHLEALFSQKIGPVVPAQAPLPNKPVVFDVKDLPKSLNVRPLKHFINDIGPLAGLVRQAGESDVPVIVLGDDVRKNMLEIVQKGLAVSHILSAPGGG